MAEAKYILKRRTVTAARRNPYRPSGQVKYGRWVTIGKFDTLEKALEALDGSSPGLYDRAVFYRGKRIER